MLKVLPNVVGLGLPKTGTATLRVALEKLGYRVTGWNRQLAEEVMSGSFDLRHYIQGWNAFADVPWCCLRDHLNAKFVLTIRDEQDWLKSICRHFDPEKNPETIGGVAFREFYFGAPWPKGNEDLYLKIYREHNDKHREGNLVVDWAESGWSELCGFLSLAVPSVEFPHVNKGEQYG